MSEPLRIAILGGGKMAVQHARAIRTLPQALLVAVADPFLSQAQLAERFGTDVAFYKSAQELLDDCRPNVVHIVTPPHTHFELACQCLENGASVYVEKPFALHASEAARILELAEAKGLHACAAHQVLFQRAGQEYQKHLPVIGAIMHVESYFSFKPVRRRADGGAPLTAVDQLIDILPHPVYLMLSALGSDDSPELTALDVAPEGEVRAIIRSGDAFATLIVTLRARPIESYLRVAGVNGSVEADFVLGSVVKSYGPGASGPALVVKPFSQSMQLFWGSFAGLMRRLFRRQKSYPGLSELLASFYASVQGKGPPPISSQTIMQTVRICEQISERLIEADRRAEAAALRALESSTHGPPIDPGRGIILVTGGSGFLGKAVVRALRSAGWHVRVVVRRLPSARQRLAGVEYLEGDLSAGLPQHAFDGVSVVAHLAAETAGDQAAHERNTVQATRKLLESMRHAGVKRLINISSVAVLRPGKTAIREDAPVDRGNLSRGPYVWAKAEAEALAIEHAQETGSEVRTVRLGPLVDFDEFTPPGRLGREVARLFVAMGSPSNALSVCDVHTAAAVIRWYASDFERTPACVNLVEAPPPSRGELVKRLREARPDLRVMWMPFPVLKAISLLALLMQKVLRRGRKPLDLYAAFSPEQYDTRVAQEVIAAAREFEKNGPAVKAPETSKELAHSAD